MKLDSIGLHIGIIAVQGGTIELIAAIIIALLTLGAVGYVMANVLDFSPRRSWVIGTLRAGVMLAGIRICCVWWLAYGFKSLWGFLPLTLAIIASYPEGELLKSLPIRMSQSPNGEPAFLGLLLYSLLLLCTTLLQVGLLAGIVAAIKRVARG